MNIWILDRLSGHSFFTTDLIVSRVSRKCLQLRLVSVLTRGRASSGGALSWGKGLDWWWVCGSVRAGVDDAEEEEDGEDEDGGWWCWWDLWLLCRWRFSKLGVSCSLKDCDRDTGGGAEGATLLLLFRAARWERTFQTTRAQRAAGQCACRTLRHTQGSFRSPSEWSRSQQICLKESSLYYICLDNNNKMLLT